MSRITEQDHAARLALYQQGMTDAQIGAKLFLSKNAVFSWRRVNGLPAHKSSRAVDHGQIIAMYQRGMNDCEIGEAVGKPRQCISKWRKRNGLPANAKPGEKRTAGKAPRVRLTLGQIAKMKHAVGFLVDRVKRGKYAMFRNFYSAPRDKDWDGLCALGFAKSQPSKKTDCVWYSVTDAGIEYLERVLEVRIVKDE